MSESNNGIRGIHYEISDPRQNPIDKYYYQRVRQVDENGNLVGMGEQIYRSTMPGSADGLVRRPIDWVKLGKLIGDAGQTVLGYMSENPRNMAQGVMKFAGDLPEGVTQDYKSWPGSERPWERPFDWKTGGSPVDFVPSAASDEIGDSRGIGSWPDSSRYMPQNQKGDAWANVPVPDRSAPSPRRPEWNDTFVRDSAAAAGIPGRNNVFEYGFPQEGAVPPSGTSVPRSMFDTKVLPMRFVSPPQQDTPGGLLGMMIQAGVIDPSNPSSRPAGGLAALFEEYLRNNPQQGN